MLLPVTCPVCGAPGAAPCRRCAAELRPAPDLQCPAGLDACLALLAYEGAGRELVARLKHRGHRAALPGLAAAVAARLLDEGAPPAGTVVTWAPTTPERRRARGLDHAELLARAVARRADLPAARLLERRPGPAQTGRTAAERATGPVFAPARRRGPPPPVVVVVDDVATTGATLAASARVLRAAGTPRVVGLVAARTPPPPGVGAAARPLDPAEPRRSAPVRSVPHGDPRSSPARR